MARSRRTTTLLLGVVAAGVLTACGSVGSSTTTTGGFTSTPASGIETNTMSGSVFGNSSAVVTPNVVVTPGGIGQSMPWTSPFGVSSTGQQGLTTFGQQQSQVQSQVQVPAGVSGAVLEGVTQYGCTY